MTVYMKTNIGFWYECTQKDRNYCKCRGLQEGNLNTEQRGSFK